MSGERCVDTLFFRLVMVRNGLKESSAENESSGVSPRTTQTVRTWFTTLTILTMWISDLINLRFLLKTDG